MRYSFNPSAGLIIVKAELWGPGGNSVIRMAIDTGCETTTIRTPALMKVGYELSVSAEIVPLVTASRDDDVAIALTLENFFALGVVRDNYAILAAKLPHTLRFDGLLGLDFFAGRHLDIDFRGGWFSFD